MTASRQRMIDQMQRRNLTAATQRSYIFWVHELAKYYHQSPDQLGPDEVERFQRYLIQDRRLSGDAIQQATSALRFFYYQVQHVDWPIERLNHPRRAHRLPVVLSRAEVDHFFQFVPTLTWRAALMTCYGTGLRVSDVVRLKVSGIGASRGLMRVEQGKGQQDRYVPLPARLREVPRDYWRALRPPEKQWLFPSPRRGRHISQTAFQQACRDACRQARLPKRVTPHALRHAFATHLREDGTNLRVMQMLLGHRRIHSTARYTAVAPQTLAAVTSPLDRWLCPPRDQ